jgi:hypothetical protein
MSNSAVATKITVKYTCACDKCGTVNIDQERSMDLEDFNASARSTPGEFWREDLNGVTQFRQHEESRDGRCSRGC